MYWSDLVVSSIDRRNGIKLWLLNSQKIKCYLKFIYKCHYLHSYLRRPLIPGRIVRIVFLSWWLGISLSGLTYFFAIGSILLLLAKYLSSASLSYVCPCSVITGSTKMRLVNGQVWAGNASSLSPMQSCVDWRRKRHACHQEGNGCAVIMNVIGTTSKINTTASYYLKVHTGAFSLGVVMYY